MTKIFGILTVVCLFLMFVCSGAGNYDAVGTFGALFFLFLFITIVCAIIAIVRTTVEVTKEAVEFVGDLIEAVVSGVIDLFTVKQQVKQKVPQAFKMKILEKKKNAIDVGIYGKNNNPLSKVRIESNDGVSEELQAGQEYYI